MVRVSVGTSRATTAPWAPSVFAWPAGRNDVPAPPSTSGAIASRCEVSTAMTGSRPADASARSRRSRVERPRGVITNGILPSRPTGNRPGAGSLVPGGSDERPARVGQRDSAPEAVEQPLAELRLEAPDAVRQRRLADVHGGGGLGEAAAVHDRQHVVDLPQFHRQNL